jgi:hypothetical protein
MSTETIKAGTLLVAMDRYPLRLPRSTGFREKWDLNVKIIIITSEFHVNYGYLESVRASKRKKLDIFVSGGDTRKILDSLINVLAVRIIISMYYTETVAHND